ncbi:MAG: MaoC family dehydratase [Alphaproteobacteria bacterium]|nr:MaoC family dehydratase [Alphaproteobacteria bacterium]
MGDYYFEDFNVGDRFQSRGKTITESEILEFALKYDPQPFHMDVEAAKAGPYGGLIASGFQTLALSFRLFFQEGILAAAGAGSPGMEELRWLKPVRPGDTIRCVMEVLEVRPSGSRPDRGTAKVRYSTLNQVGETVMTAVVYQLLSRRPTATG